MAVSAPYSDNSMMSDHLSCPICLEVCQNPQTLMCMHAFCGGCIQTYMANNEEKCLNKREMECPVCRQLTMPSVSPPETTPSTKSKKKLPVSSRIVPMMSVVKSVDIESTCDARKLCQPCGRTNPDINPAVSYCTVCKEYQCANCVEHHLKFLPLKGHKIVPLDTESTSNDLVHLGKIEYCPLHESKDIEFYCVDHRVMCCSTCAIVCHRHCKQVCEGKDLGQLIKKTDKLIELRAQIVSLRGQLERFIDSMEANISDIDKQAEALPMTIQHIRNKITHILDALVLNVSSDCAQQRTESTAKLSTQIFHGKQLLSAIDSSSKLLEAVLEHGTDPQVFITFHRLMDKVVTYNKTVQDLSEETSKIKLQLDVNKELKAVSESCEPLAKVSVKVEKPGIKFRPLPCLVSECGIEILSPPVVQQLSKHVDWPWYKGIVSLPEGRIVAINIAKDQCCLLDETSKVLFHADLPQPPSSIARTGISEVVVVLQGLIMQLQYVTVSATKLHLGRRVFCTRSPTCVAAIDSEDLAVGYATGFGIITRDGTEKSYFERETTGRSIQFKDEGFIAVDAYYSRVYQSDDNANALYCFQMTGEPIFTYKAEHLDGPRGVALDRDGNVYVCSKRTNTVLQISQTGSLMNVFGEIGTDPYSLSFRCGSNPKKYQLFIMNSTQLKKGEPVGLRRHRNYYTGELEYLTEYEVVNCSTQMGKVHFKGG